MCVVLMCSQRLETSPKNLIYQDMINSENSKDCYVFFFHKISEIVWLSGFGHVTFQRLWVRVLMCPFESYKFCRLQVRVPVGPFDAICSGVMILRLRQIITYIYPNR